VPVSPAIPSLFHVTDGIAAATLVGWCSYYWTASSSQTSTLDCSASWLCPLQTSSTLQLLQLSTCIQHVRWTLQHAILTTNACPQCSRICCNKSQQERAQPCSESNAHVAHTSAFRECHAQLMRNVAALQGCRCLQQSWPHSNALYLNVHLTITKLAATGSTALTKHSGAVENDCSSNVCPQQLSHPRVSLHVLCIGTS